MTNKEDIKFLKEIRMCKLLNVGQEIVIDMDIDALSQEPCEDYISREAVLDALHLEGRPTKRFDYFIAVKNDIIALPSVTPKEKTGHWLHREDMDYLDENKVMHNHFMCKDCGFIHDFMDGHTAQYKYCPSCGAKMIEPQESEVNNG